MDNKYIDMIDARISAFEVAAKSGRKFSKDELAHLDEFSEKVMKNAGIPEELKNSVVERLKNLEKFAEPDEKFVENVSTETISVPATGIAKIKNIFKSTKARVIAGVTVAAVTIGGVAYALNKNDNNTDTAVATEAQVDNNDTMDEYYQELAEDITVSMNDQISKGLEVTEENKDTMAKKYTEYYALNQMDELTDEQWANIFQNSTITSDDIINAKFDMEWIDEQRVTVCPSDMYLDYSLMFDGADAELLNDAAVALDKIKTTNGSEREAAIEEFKSYVQDKLNTNNGRMQYSERALDTFRAVYFDAFDELTNHAVVDDELEHAINTTITCSLNTSDLDVKDTTIKSLQSDFEIYEKNKIQTRLENGWNYASTHKLNENNDINKISEYVSNNIDLSLYKELPDYEATLESMFLVNDGKSKNDSGISDGKGGHISSEQFAQYGINPADPNAKQKLEQAVEAEDKEKSDASETTQDVAGNQVDPDMANYYTQLGASDYNSGNYDESKVPEQYKPSYRNGGDVAKAAKEEAQSSIVEEETFEPASNGASEVTETTEDLGYTPYSIESTSVDVTNSFEPVSNGASEVTETIENYDFVPSATTYSLESADLQELQEFRDYLVDETIEEYGYTKTK